MKSPDFLKRLSPPVARLLARSAGLSLGTYLAFSFALLSICLTLILVTVISITVTDQRRSNIAANLAGSARQMSDLLDRSMFERYRDVQLFAERLSYLPMDDRESWQKNIRRTLDLLQETYPFYAWLGVTDVDGRVLAATQGQLMGVDVSDRPWFKNASLGLHLGDVHEVKLLAQLLPGDGVEPLRFVDVAFEYRGPDGESRGVMGAHLYWQWAKDIQKSILAAVSAGRTLDAMIVSSDNAVLLGSPALQGKVLTQPSVVNITPGSVAHSVEMWPDGREYVVGVSQSQGYQSYPGLGWKVVVRQELAEAYQPVRELQNRVLWTGLAIAALFSLLGWLASRAITRPLAALSRSARQLEGGSATEIEDVPTPYREVRVLNRSLNSLIRSRSLSESRMRTILLAAKDAIITFDDHQKILMFNAAASAMFECPKPQAIGSLITTFIPERLHEQHHQHVHQYREGGAAFGQAVGLKRSGVEFPVDVSYSTVVEAGGVLHTLIIRDITSRLASYEALKRSNYDLQQFAYVASHDLKTPLRSIGGFVQLLERKYADKLDAGALDLIHRAGSATRRLEHMTDDLLAYARVNADSALFEVVPLDEVGHEVVQLLDAVVVETGAVINVDALPRVRGNRSQLVQLLLNLIGNGLKYCEKRPPQITVSASKQDTQWLICVQDNGIGIEKQHFDRIFEVFKRLHSQKEYAGTGIGLALCRRVVEHHGGSIWVTSVPGQGSQFFFTIPAIIDESTLT